MCRRSLPLEAYRVSYDGRRKKMCKDCENKILRKHNITRRCHDCGTPTNNYRCSRCWSKVRHGEPSMYGVDPQYLP